MSSAAFADRFPVSEGHALIVPRRHVARIEDLAEDEWRDLFGLARALCREVLTEPGVDGYNLGVNSGAAAGQTVEHAHVHLIPRRVGDVPDPRGGIRHVIATKADYWTTP